MKFAKMHGLGNDFIMLDGFSLEDRDYNALAKKLCDRRQAIGGDGLIIALPSDKADIRMRIINSDGSEAEMCGNGIRCFAHFAQKLGRISKNRFTVDTLAGIITPEILESGDTKCLVRVDMGEPQFERGRIPMLGPAGEVEREQIEAGGRSFTISSMLMGVPHTVVFVDKINMDDVVHFGALMERHPAFPRKTNVNFMQPISQSRVRVRTFERGAGLTLACGTGACASAVAAARAGLTGREVDVELELGCLRIEWLDSNRVMMTGPAELVFEGKLAGNP